VEKPALAPHLSFHPLDDRQVFLISENASTLLHGTIHADLLPLLDGQRSRREIVASLADRHPEANVKAALGSLSSKGYLISAEHGMDPGLAAFWTGLGASPRWAQERLSASPVTLSGDSGSFAARLDSLGVRLAEAGEEAALRVVLTDDYLDERHSGTDRKHLASGAPWMLAKTSGFQLLFGPVFRPRQQGPCWACLAYRLRGHQEVHNFLRNLTDGTIPLGPRAAAPASREGVHGLAAAEIAKWLVLSDVAPLHRNAISVDAGDLALARHRVMRRPQCRDCGDPSLFRPDRPPVPVRLRPSPKSFRNSGGSRSVPPEITLAKYRHLVDPVGGVVTWLRRTTGGSDPWLHVNWAGSNLALRNRAISVLRLALRTKSAGKGSTPAQSEASALAEALERYSGAFHGDEICSRKRFADLSPEERIHPNEVQLFSEEQLDAADRINAGGHPYNVVPPRLDPEAELEWTPVWSLTRDRPRYLPTSLLYYGKSAGPRGISDFVADSNGCAAGNTREEAILQGFFELVERDAFAIWWYNRLRVPGVDLASFDDEYLATAGDYYRGLKRDLWVLDATSDFGIPTFVALSRRTDKEAEDIIYGAGSHTDPRIAALRAVCEMNQFLNWVQGTGPGGAGYRVDDPQCLEWWKTAKLADLSYLEPAADAPATGRSRYPVQENGDLLEDVERCRGLVEERGLEFLVLDQTRPDIGMPVVRVIVPGMRHYWERFAPGRLYDVPVGMGVRERPLSEAQLNPAPVIG